MAFSGPSFGRCWSGIRQRVDGSFNGLFVQATLHDNLRRRRSDLPPPEANMAGEPYQFVAFAIRNG